MSKLKHQYKMKRITPPDFVVSGLQYECIMGSFAYGVNSDISDLDIYGFCIPHRDIVFPFEKQMYISGFDKNDQERFAQYQEHHIFDPDSKIEYDFSITSISNYFRKLCNGTPNMIDSLFVPRECITYSTRVGELVRENRHMFLSKKLFHSFKGYAFSMLSKLRIKNHELTDLRQFEKENNLFQKGIKKEDIEDELKKRNLL